MTRKLTDPSQDVFHDTFREVAGENFPIDAIDTAYDAIYKGGWSVGSLISPGTGVRVSWTWDSGTLTVRITKD